VRVIVMFESSLAFISEVDLRLGNFEIALTRTLTLTQTLTQTPTLTRTLTLTLTLNS
jgi:hypothetical protein